MKQLADFKHIVNFKKKIFYWHKNENVVYKLAPNNSLKCMLQYWGQNTILSLFAVFAPSAHFPGCWGGSLTTVTNPAT